MKVITSEYQDIWDCCSETHHLFARRESVWWSAKDVKYLFR